MNPKKIFICSTCYDLKDLRAELKNAILNWGHEPILSEDSEEFLVRLGVDSYTACVEAVKKSDMLILIVGKRYGGRVPNKDISITELEYNTAVEKGIPRINLCLKEVWNLAQVWKGNPDMKFPKNFKDGHKVMEFLDRIRKVGEGKSDNWIHLFETSVDIKKILKTQLGIKDTKIGIIKIETLLEKEKSKEPRFFRPSGSEWIDFEEDFVVERKEVNKIIEKFDNEDLVLIKGNPASGKSVILRNVGYELENQGKEVYVIELKGTPPERSEVLKLRRGYLFIEDAYLNPEYVNDLVRSLSGVKILISTRDVEERFGPASYLKIPEYLKDAIEVKGYDVAEGIIERFSEKRKKIPKEIKGKLTKNNLWILAWELEAYEEFDKIDENAVSKRIMNYIRRDLEARGAENVFLPLSIFYIYGIPLRKEFVEELAESDEDIEKLIELNEINKVEENGFEYLTLHHSETAKLFLKTFQKFDGFGNKVKKKVGDNWFENMFHLYIQEFPKECVGVIGELDPDEVWLIKNLVEENFDKVEESIKAEEDIGQIGSCIWRIAIGSKELAEKLVKSLDLEMLKDKIEAEENIVEIGSCIRGIASGSKELAEKLIPIVRCKIEVEENVQSIGWCTEGIARGNKEVAEKLVKSLDFEKLKNKVEKEEGVREISCCISGIAHGSKEVAEKLIPVLSNKLEIEDDFDKISTCIFWFNLGGKESKELAEKLIPVVKNRIELEEDVTKISVCVLFCITRGSKKFAEKLIPVLSNKLEIEDDFGKILFSIHGISLGSKEAAFKLLNRLNPRKAKNHKVRMGIIKLKRMGLKH
jgi:hypothetical protein